MSGKYDDILYLPHHVSPTRLRMTMVERAAQFSPFAALAGYEDAVRETGRVVDQRVELSEDEKAVLDWKQQIILAALERGEQPEVTITYFQLDRKKAGGKYVTRCGNVKRVEEIENTIVLGNKIAIPLNDIVDLSSKLFQWLFES